MQHLPEIAFDIDAKIVGIRNKRLIVSSPHFSQENSNTARMSLFSKLAAPLCNTFVGPYDTVNETACSDVAWEDVYNDNETLLSPSNPSMIAAAMKYVWNET